jgi:hypothetical protein
VRFALWHGLKQILYAAGMSLEESSRGFVASVPVTCLHRPNSCGNLFPMDTGPPGTRARTKCVAFSKGIRYDLLLAPTIIFFYEPGYGSRALAGCVTIQSV